MKAQTLFIIKRDKDGLYYYGEMDGVQGSVFVSSITSALKYATRDEAIRMIQELQTRKWYRLFRKDKYTIMVARRFYKK